jgi:hypothetical protein
MSRSVDITNQQFGRLTAVRMTARRSKGPPQRMERWLFRCSCGNEHEADKAHVMRGCTSSCGCWHVEDLRKRRTTHGHPRHGQESPEYRAWESMRERCSNPNNTGWEHYGGRGITVCPRWDKFENFLADMGRKPSPQHSIDRIDPNGNYELSNCRWATPIDQQNNKRSNHRVTIGGREATIAEHAREANMNPKHLLKRVNDGWSPEILAALLRIYRERAEGAEARP